MPDELGAKRQTRPEHHEHLPPTHPLMGTTADNDNFGYGFVQMQVHARARARVQGLIDLPRTFCACVLLSR
jgi:hypothetical protein